MKFHRKTIYADPSLKYKIYFMKFHLIFLWAKMKRRKTCPMSSRFSLR